MTRHHATATSNLSAVLLLVVAGCGDSQTSMPSAAEARQPEAVAVTPEPESKLHRNAVDRIDSVLATTPASENNNVIRQSVGQVDIEWTFRKWARANALHWAEARLPRDVAAAEVPELIRPAWLATDRGIVGDDGTLAVELATVAMQHGSASCESWDGIKWDCRRVDHPINDFDPSEQWRLVFDFQPVAKDYTGPDRCEVGFRGSESQPPVD